MSYTEVALENKELEEIWEERAAKLFGEDKAKTADRIEKLKEISKQDKQLTLPNEDEFYLKFLRGGLMDPKQSLDVIKSYYALRKSHPHYFKNCKNIEEIVRTTFSEQIHAMLTHRDGEGRRVYVFRPGRWNPDKVSFTDLFCAGYMLCEMVSREERTQIAGITAVCDAQGFGWKQLRAVSLDDGRNLAQFFNISFPIWLRQTHVLNAPRVFNILFGMLRAFLSEPVRDGIVFHSGDLSSMKTYFSRLDILPKDLGGTGPATDNSHNVTELRTMKNYFDDLDKYGYKDG